MLMGWTPLILPIKMDSIDDVWNSLVDVMPVWRRDDPDATDEQKKQKKCLVLAGFTSIMNKSHLKPFSPSQMQNIVKIAMPFLHIAVWCFSFLLRVVCIWSSLEGSQSHTFGLQSPQPSFVPHVAVPGAGWTAGPTTGWTSPSHAPSTLLPWSEV